MRRLAFAVAFALWGVAAVTAAPRIASGQTNCVVTNAASCTTQITGTLPIQYVVKLTLSTTTVTLTTAGVTQFTDAGAIDAGPVATIKANSSWTLGIMANAATWTGTGAVANPSKPAGDLKWGLTNNVNGTFTPLSTTSVAVKTGTATASQLVPIFFNTSWIWAADPPGNYSIALKLTLTAP